MRMKSREFMDKDVFALDEKIGKVKEIEVEPEEWKVTHLEIELEKDIAESVLGAKKGGVRNMLAISALEKGVARWTDKGLHLKVSKDQLLVLGTCEVDLLIILGVVPCLSSVQLLSLGLKWPACFVLHLSLRQALIQRYPFPIRFQDESLSTLPALLLFP